MSHKPIIKTPYDRFQFYVEHEGVLPYSADNQIASATATVTNRNSEEVQEVLVDQRGLILESRVYFEIQGGKHRENYSINVFTVFNNGARKEDNIPLSVRSGRR